MPARFDRAFLEVPQECLILTMQQNQKYFALADDAGALRHRFLLVSNLPCDDPSAIVHGNERVLRARLADARFFYDQDRTIAAGFACRAPAQRRLSQQARQQRRACRPSGCTWRRRSRRGSAPTPAHAERAALLAKADLVTDMVGEFPELQGTMGRYYALHDGEARGGRGCHRAALLAAVRRRRAARARRRADGRAGRQARVAGGDVRHRPGADR